jgi:hypothetical protein
MSKQNSLGLAVAGARQMPAIRRENRNASSHSAKDSIAYNALRSGDGRKKGGSPVIDLPIEPQVAPLLRARLRFRRDSRLPLLSQ